MVDSVEGGGGGDTGVRMRMRSDFALDAPLAGRVVLLVRNLVLVPFHGPVALLLRNGAEDDVHLLEGATLGLGDEEREDAHAENVDRAEHEEHFVTQVGDDGRSLLRDDEVCEQDAGKYLLQILY